MKRWIRVLITSGLVIICILAATRFGSSVIHSSHGENYPLQSALEKREAAYRANNIGVALLEQYKAKEAVETVTRALEIKPDLLIARVNLAIALYYLPDTEGAKREAEAALKQDPNSPQPHYILGLIARGQNRFDEAIAEFQKVLKLDADDVGANVNLGQIFVQQKRSADAIAAFRRAIAAEPYNETALYNLGLLLTRTGKKQEGQQLLQKFQQLKQSGAGTTLGTNYLESGHYAEAIVSTGLEADLVDRNIPNVSFVDATVGRLQKFSMSESDSGTPFRPVIGRQFNIRKENDRTSLLMPSLDQVKDEIRLTLGNTATLFDYDGDGDLDLFWAFGEQRLYRNDGGTFTDITDQSVDLRPLHRTPIAVVAGDYDNDGRPDLLVIREGSISLYRNVGFGRFADVTKTSGIPNYPYLPSATAFVDVDHDGDLDIFITGLADLSKPPKGYGAFPADFVPAPNLLLRNNGNGKFTDTTAAAKLDKFGHAVAVVPTDFNNGRDIDLLLLNYGASPDLYSNERDGTFRNVSNEVGLNVVGPWTCVAAGDINKDGYTDFFFGRAHEPGLFAISDGKRKFKTLAAPPGTRNALAAQFLDYDNDGLLDCLISGDGALHVLRNIGNDWADVTESAVAANARTKLTAPGDHRLFVTGDVNNDGNIDAIWLSAIRNLRVGLNQSRANNHPLRVGLKGKVSNQDAIGAKIEIRAGSLYQKLETYSASPAPAPADLIFGLGKREKPDAVRVLWPAGIVQAETEFPLPTRAHPGLVSLNITELDRKPSSCPYLYTWNGQRFEFVTDFMGGGEMGYLEQPGLYNHPDPDEYVRIRADQLKEKNGRYELRVTNELEEALFVDRLQLLAVTHPLGTEIYPNEGMSWPPKTHRLFLTQNARPPLGAIDDKGNDVLGRITYLDRHYPDDFKIDRIRGYAEDHTLILKLAEPSQVQSPKSNVKAKTLDFGHGTLDGRKHGHLPRTVLLLTGWTDYAWSSDNVAAAQAGKTMKPPSLQVKDEVGNWRTVIEDIGIPVGRPQTVTVDLSGKFLSQNREVRIVTNMRIYWDQILIDTSDGKTTSQVVRLDPFQADLRWRGFSAEMTSDGREPFAYDYQKISFLSPWKVMTGHYTVEGDVRELLLKIDDMFAICRPGDEISLSFDATALPPLPAGWTRTFLLYADGFSKEMDINSASPDQVSPLPFHGMSRYPYRWPERYPLTEARRQYIEKYNTRVVTAPVASISSLLFNR